MTHTHSVGPCRRDRPFAETSTWHATLTGDRHLRSQRDSNPQT